MANATFNLGDQVINPYVSNSAISANWQSAMTASAQNAYNSLAAATPAQPNISTMNQAVVSGLIANYFTTLAGGAAAPLNDAVVFSTPELLSLVGEVQNGYLYGELFNNSVMSGNQMAIVRQLLAGVYSIPPTSIGTIIIGPTTVGPNNITINYTGFLDDMNEVVATSGLSAEEKAPLYMAILLGNTAFTYWSGIIAATIVTPWVPFFDQITPNSPYNIALLAPFVAITIEGALLGYIGSSLMDTTQNMGNKIISMIAGSASLMACKAVFRYDPKQRSTISKSNAELNINFNRQIM